MAMQDYDFANVLADLPGATGSSGKGGLTLNYGAHTTPYKAGAALARLGMPTYVAPNVLQSLVAQGLTTSGNVKFALSWAGYGIAGYFAAALGCAPPTIAQVKAWHAAYVAAQKQAK